MIGLGRAHDSVLLRCKGKFDVALLGKVFFPLKKKRRERERLSGKEETFMINIHLFLVFVILFITDLYFKYSSLKWLQPFYRKNRQKQSKMFNEVSWNQTSQPSP